MQDDVVAEYADTLTKLTEAELDAAISEAKKVSDKYVPSPGEIYTLAMESRTRQSTPVLDEMKTWTRSDPEWPEVKEFMKLVKSVSAEKDLAREKQKVFIRPTPSPAFYDQRKALIEWYLRQDLYDGTPRSKSEIAAIKATQPQRKRKHADLQHR